MASTHGAEHGLKRFAGFTDAVFAIALTLLFVEIVPPGSPDGPPAAADVARAVAEQWRDHLALIVSFLGIGIYWLQHYYSGSLYAKSDHVFSLINLGFLFGIMALPYPSRLWAFHLGSAGE
ncbi:TMEM175 family protein [Falsirhodobacter sp. 1013]